MSSAQKKTSNVLKTTAPGAPGPSAPPVPAPKPQPPKPKPTGQAKPGLKPPAQPGQAPTAPSAPSKVSAFLQTMAGQGIVGFENSEYFSERVWLQINSEHLETAITEILTVAYDNWLDAHVKSTLEDAPYQAAVTAGIRQMSRVFIVALYDRLQRISQIEDPTVTQAVFTSRRRFRRDLELPSGIVQILFDFGTYVPTDHIYNQRYNWTMTRAATHGLAPGPIPPGQLVAPPVAINWTEFDNFCMILKRAGVPFSRTQGPDNTGRFWMTLDRHNEECKSKSFSFIYIYVNSISYLLT